MGFTSRYTYAAKHIATKEYEHHSIADSGTTSHYLRTTCSVMDKVRVNEGIRVVLPNGKIITSTHQTYLNIPQYPKAARNAHILLALSHDVLIAIS